MSGNPEEGLEMHWNYEVHVVHIHVVVVVMSGHVVPMDHGTVG